MKIRVLPPAVAERIAAGEVIERPVSVVKELVENSIDSGATEIAVAVEDGGKTLIQVVDNGCGMSAEDLGLSVTRHATSKLQTLEDLDRIHTLGFRGEALPSISAVSEVTLLSRAEGSSDTWQIKPSIERSTVSEKVTFGQFLGSDHGTMIKAEGIFSQIPARLKFLKSTASEVSQIREWIEKLSIANPDVGFLFSNQDRSVSHLPRKGTATLESRLKKILADDQDLPIVTDESKIDDIHVRVHWIQGLSSPQTKKLIQIVNGRVVRDRFLQQAMLSPFRQSLLPGQFPALCLDIKVDPSKLDVNVHPTKFEIRFLESQKVFHAIQSLIKKMVEVRGTPVTVPGYSLESSPAPIYYRASEPTWQTEMNYVPSAIPTAPHKTHLLSGSKYIGSLFLTYLMFEQGEELIMVDQHAAHERIRFEKLRKGQFTSQSLLLPETVHMESDHRPTVEARLGLLSEMGFEAEIFGEDSVLFRSIPSEWGNQHLGARLSNLVERLIAEAPSAKNIVLDEHLFEKLASEACRSSVMAGDHLDAIEVTPLIENLFDCENPWNCPHGRPTVVRIPRNRLEEWFQRREKK